jgi:hypothetical protein
LPVNSRKRALSAAYFSRTVSMAASLFWMVLHGRLVVLDGALEILTFLVGLRQLVLQALADLAAGLLDPGNAGTQVGQVLVHGLAADLGALDRQLVMLQRAVARQVDFRFGRVGLGQGAIDLRLPVPFRLDPFLLGQAFGRGLTLGFGLRALDHQTLLVQFGTAAFLVSRRRRVAVVHAAVAVDPAVHRRLRHPCGEQACCQQAKRRTSNGSLPRPAILVVCLHHVPETPPDCPA